MSQVGLVQCPYCCSSDIKSPNSDIPSKTPEKEQRVPESDEIQMLRAEMDYLTSKLDSTDPENRKRINWYENRKKQFASGEIRLTEFEEALIQYFDWIEFHFIEEINE